VRRRDHHTRGRIGAFSEVAAPPRGVADAPSQLETALDLANIERSDGNPATASAQIDELSGQPLDSAIVAARIARASQLWSQGKTEEARDAMTSALGDWIKAQPHQTPHGDLERDLAAVRNAVFHPLGDGIFAGRPRRNAFTWPPALPRFLLMNPEIAVKLASSDETTVIITSAIPGLPNVILPTRRWSICCRARSRRSAARSADSQRQ
jgi:hypothetical protein